MWWGRREPDLYKLPFSVQERIDKETRSEKAAQSKGIPFSQRSLLIEGLPKGQTDLVECQAVEFALTETFSEWVVEDTSVVPGEGYAFLRVRFYIHIAFLLFQLYVCTLRFIIFCISVCRLSFMLLFVGINWLVHMHVAVHCRGRA